MAQRIFTGLSAADNLDQWQTQMTQLRRAEREIQRLERELTQPPKTQKRKYVRRSLMPKLPKMIQSRSLLPVKESKITFVEKLIQLANDPMTDHYIKWVERGWSITFNRDVFQDQFLRSPFKNKAPISTQNWSSFLRQLNLYGFKKKRKNVPKVGLNLTAQRRNYWHEYIQLNLKGEPCRIGQLQEEKHQESLQKKSLAALNPQVQPAVPVELPPEEVPEIMENKENVCPYDTITKVESVEIDTRVTGFKATTSNQPIHFGQTGTLVDNFTNQITPLMYAHGQF